MAKNCIFVWYYKLFLYKNYEEFWVISNWKVAKTGCRVATPQAIKTNFIFEILKNSDWLMWFMSSNYPLIISTCFWLFMLALLSLRIVSLRWYIVYIAYEIPDAKNKLNHCLKQENFFFPTMLRLKKQCLHPIFSLL